MLPDDDPRHGKLAGAVAHRKAGEKLCDPCALADYRYSKLRRLDHTQGRPRMLPAIGFQRRVRALQAMGYQLESIAAHLGITRGLLSVRLYRSEWISRTNHLKMTKVYDRLCMVTPEKPSRRTLLYAAREGWLPPLAWDDDTIDDPNFTPGRTRPMLISKDIDPIVIERILAGDTYLHTTVAEKHEAMRRWKAMGRSERSLCELTGWKESRYGRDEDVA